ncbi:MAG: glutamine--fructose-6-phosphate transaminase (isomerizing) [Gammaproteobacteria bacterium]|nr:glutamine--fructose-6-phosphate transaminase (isomerizing) [Gammaproteobacteria bacterium]
MCGIIGAVAQRDVGPLLLEGLKRLEYRGYDSAGIAVLNAAHAIERVRVQGKVKELAATLSAAPMGGGLGIAHTRWATHGRPSVRNAHPQMCGEVALVHNGIIENHADLRGRQRDWGYEFESETDTEVAVHQIHRHLHSGLDLLHAVRATVAELRGTYALGVICSREPERLVAARLGSPLVIGVGIGEYFLASDVFALLPITRSFMILEDGDVADLGRDGVRIYDRHGAEVKRETMTTDLTADAAEKSGYRHYMLKEIFSQPAAVAETVEGCISGGRVRDDAFGMPAAALLDRTRCVQMVACGTSYHAGLIARHWLESIAGIACHVEIASEYRYRRPVVPPDTLFIVISQSGETADTLAALRVAREQGYAGTLAICNVPESSLTREADLVFLTRAGPEIGVASTKAFTTQLASLFMLAVLLARRRGMGADEEGRYVELLEALPGKINQALGLNGKLASLAQRFAPKQHALYLGRGQMLPVAMEGALKLKEISYIHAEAYAAGELKHGPLALVDKDMPVIAVAPNNELLKKLESNLHEVRARGGELYVFADTGADMEPAPGVHVIGMAPVEDCIAPLIYTVPLQLLAYHVGVIRGADVDQPRNLAKSVTVE